MNENEKQLSRLYRMLRSSRSNELVVSGDVPWYIDCMEAAAKNEEDIEAIHNSVRGILTFDAQRDTRDVSMYKEMLVEFQHIEQSSMDIERDWVTTAEAIWIADGFDNVYYMDSSHTPARYDIDEPDGEYIILDAALNTTQFPDEITEVDVSSYRKEYVEYVPIPKTDIELPSPHVELFLFGTYIATTILSIFSIVPIFVPWVVIPFVFLSMWLEEAELRKRKV